MNIYGNVRKGDKFRLESPNDQPTSATGAAGAAAATTTIVSISINATSAGFAGIAVGKEAYALRNYSSVMCDF
jgi:hypothetical protein